jgi:hypothetical protein
LLDRFWGWSDQQLPDGTVIWKSPTNLDTTDDNGKPAGQLPPPPGDDDPPPF